MPRSACHAPRVLSSRAGGRNLVQQCAAAREASMIRFVLPAFAAILSLLSTLSAAVAQNSAADIALDGGGSERVLFAAVPNPRAVLIMLPGGDGIIEIGQRAASGGLSYNFLVRTLPLWTAQGFAVEILGSPNGQSLLGQRHTPAYAAAIGHAIDFAHTRASAPVWLVGTSQGSTAAANGAAQLGGNIAGVVM